MGRGPYRCYSDLDKADALALLKANRGNACKTANELGIPRNTLIQWAGRTSYYQPPEGSVSTSLRQERDQELARRFRGVTDKLLAVVEEKANDAPVQQAMVGAGIGLDKALLLEGRPTEISATLLQGLEPAQIEAVALLGAIAQKSHLWATCPHCGASLEAHDPLAQLVDQELPHLLGPGEGAGEGASGGEGGGTMATPPPQDTLTPTPST